MLALFFILVNLLTRLSFLFGFSDSLPPSFDLITALIKGIINDVITIPFVLALPAIFLLLPTAKFMERKFAGNIYIGTTVFLFLFVFTFTAFAEYLFWEEFSSRFNFIAVDYLVYTQELIGNIVESYPLIPIFSVIFIISGVSSFLILKKIIPLKTNAALSHRVIYLGIIYCAALFVYFCFNPLEVKDNRYWNEFAKNGTYSFFSAYKNNQLDYRAFYKVIDDAEAFSLLHNSMRSEPADSSNAKSVLHRVQASGKETTPNVVIVIMESMGKYYMPLTPYLNMLASKGLSFSNMQSTGTRTVRGIEAVMLSIPPTPGNSIVRRPNNADLFTLGSLFKKHGYDRDFIYGGLGYFDNMNAFFASNGYSITDRRNFHKEHRTFANIWGQCDEDTFAESLRIADESYSKNKPFHQVVLTTSNHRPYTFPTNNPLNLEQKTRASAVLYSDYAANEFIKKAQSKPWFDNTIFVFVGDHPAAIAGKTEVPPNAYGIICFFYAPKLIFPQKISVLCSQIDIAPTLLSMLKWSYTSSFFGLAISELSAHGGRAFISTYQLLGYLTSNRLAILKPDKTADIMRLNKSDNTDSERENALDESCVKTATAFYQCAYDSFTNGTLKEKAVDR